MAGEEYYVLSKNHTDKKVNELQTATSKRLRNVEEQANNLQSMNINNESVITETTQDKLSVLPQNVANRPLKVEFHGGTLTNLLGKYGNFEKDTNADGLADGWVANQGTYSLVQARIGTYAQQYSREYSTGYLRYDLGDVVRDISKKFIILFDTKKDSNNSDTIRFRMSPDQTYDIFNLTEEWNTNYIKFTGNTDNKSLYFYLPSDANGVDLEGFIIDGVRLLEISQETYDKIGVSLTDADVERMFPYVDSVQHVKNPVVTVSGKNLFDGELESGAIYTSNGSTNTDTTKVRSVNFTEVNKSTVYTIGRGGSNITTGGNVYFYDDNKDYISWVSIDSNFTTPSNCRYVKFQLSSTTDVNVLIQIELGNTVTPYTDYNPSYLYAETTLAGNNDKKDILSYNSDASRWEKIKGFEIDEVLTVDTDASTLTKTPVDGTVVIYDNADGSIVTDFTQSGTTITYTNAPTSPIATYQLATVEFETVEGIYGTPIASHSHLTYDHVLGKLGDYNNGIVESGTFSEIVKVEKVDKETGEETDITDSCTLNAEKNGFTSTELVNGDLVWYELKVSNNAIGEVAYSYYDSRYVVMDDTDGKVYGWKITSSNGTPTVTLTEI